MGESRKTKTMLDIIKPIEAELQSVHSAVAEALASQYPMLSDVASYLAAPGGKMLRPTLTLLFARHYGEPSPRTVEVATMVELVHYATLVHDDIIDEAYTRRGELTLGALLRSRSAVLVGDYIFSKGLACATRAGAYEELDIVIKAIEELVEGELLQAQIKEQMDTSVSGYLQVARLKTASLLSAAARCGVVSVGAGEQAAQRAREFAEKVGLVFQIQDDVMDYLPQKLTGKEPYNDIKERKMTLPLLLAIEAGGGRGVIKDLKRGNIERVVAFVQEHDGVGRTKAYAEELMADARAIIEELDDSAAKESLLRAVAFAGARLF